MDINYDIHARLHLRICYMVNEDIYVDKIDTYLRVITIFILKHAEKWLVKDTLNVMSSNEKIIQYERTNNGQTDSTALQPMTGSS